MSLPERRFDFFVAHAAADVRAAMTLYRALSKGHQVFLDVVSLMPGDDWAVEISRAQLRSRVTVVLVSPRTERAYYQREEILQAIDLFREGSGRHRVVPVYLTTPPAPPDVHYGLRGIHALFAESSGALRRIARSLSGLVGDPDDPSRQRNANDVKPGAQYRQVAKPRRAIISFTCSYQGQAQWTIHPGEVIEVGRLPDTGLVFDHPRVSRRHAQLSLTPDGLVITDIQSKNHVYVNGTMIASAEVLRAGDVVHLSRAGPTIQIISAPSPAMVTEEQTADT